MKTKIITAICLSMLALSYTVRADDACQAAQEDANKGFNQAASGNVSDAIDTLNSALDNAARCITGQDSNRSDSNNSGNGSNDSGNNSSDSGNNSSDSNGASSDDGGGE